jgi:hypothetical protein
MFIRFILFLFLFYFIYLAVRYIIKVFKQYDSGKQQRDVKGESKSKLNINKDDIIDADFEELKDDNKEESK